MLPYPVVVARDARPALRERIRELSPTKVVVVTDSNVARLVKLDVNGPSSDLVGSSLLEIEAGERSKTIATVEKLWRGFHAVGLDRKGLVVALGGGVVGDTAGFAAATWMRGTRIVHVPTTLLAMVDSAIGGKTGVDLEGKNLVGAFHQPSGVFASLDALSTLPPREVSCGLGEVLKSALLSGEALLARVERDAAKLRALDVDALEPVIRGCLELKGGIVARDPFEEGERALLNLGHTLGHALETLGGYEDLRHGEAVAIGLVFAHRLANRHGLEAARTERVVAVARALGLPVHRSFEPERALELMRKDKKAIGGKIRFVLPREGRCEVVPLEEKPLLEALREFAREK